MLRLQEGARALGAPLKHAGSTVPVSRSRVATDKDICSVVERLFQNCVGCIPTDAAHSPGAAAGPAPTCNRGPGQLQPWSLPVGGCLSWGVARRAWPAEGRLAVTLLLQSQGPTPAGALVTSVPVT